MRGRSELRRRRAFRERDRSGNGTFRERELSGNEGVGEHVRTRFHGRALTPGEIAGVKDTRTERRKTCFFCRTGFERAKLLERTLFRNTIQPFDLMSRRHPLFVNQSLQTFIRGSNDVPASSRRQSWRSEVTSSSWRPCGSSSQSSSLRSSPSLPS